MKYRQPQNRKISEMVKGIGIKTLKSNGNDPRKVLIRIVKQRIMLKN